MELSGTLCVWDLRFSRLPTTIHWDRRALREYRPSPVAQRTSLARSNREGKPTCSSVHAGAPTCMYSATGRPGAVHRKVVRPYWGNDETTAWE